MKMKVWQCNIEESKDIKRRIILAKNIDNHGVLNEQILFAVI